MLYHCDMEMQNIIENVNHTGYLLSGANRLSTCAENSFYRFKRVDHFYSGRSQY